MPDFKNLAYLRPGSLVISQAAFFFAENNFAFQRHFQVIFINFVRIYFFESKTFFRKFKNCFTNEGDKYNTNEGDKYNIRPLCFIPIQWF